MPKQVFRSRVAAVSAGALLVVGLGAAGAVAANPDRDVTPNGRIKSFSVEKRHLTKQSVGAFELARGAVRSPQISDNAVAFRDLRPWVQDRVLEAGPRGPEGPQGETGPKGDPGTPGEDASVCTIPGAQYAINDMDSWTVLGRPFSTPNVDVRLGSDGVRLKTDQDSGYADAGVIVPIGTLGEQFDAEGNYIGPPLQGADGEGPVAVNLYVDTNADQTYLDFGNGGYYIGNGGDTIHFSYQGEPQRTDFTAPDGARVWAWAGVAGNQEQEATINEVDGMSLAGC